MIHRNFYDNWMKIIKYNKKEFQKKENEKEEAVRIPLTPIKINPILLNSLFGIIYPKFINDQQNVVDLIISDDEKIFEKIVLYETEEPGIHKSYKILENDILKLKKYPLKETRAFFNKLQEEIFKKHRIRVSHMRVFKKNAIELLNQHLKDIKQRSLEDCITNLFSIIEEIIRNQLFFIYPKTNIINFFEELTQISDNNFLSNGFKFIKEILPPFNYAFLIRSGKSSFILRIENNRKKKKKTELDLQIFPAESFNIDFSGTNVNELLKSLYLQLRVDFIFLFELKHILTLISNIFELQHPIALEKIKLLFQKFLFGLRSYETFWYKYPKPLSYNPILRYFLRLFGFIFYLKKLSHWEIPEFLFGLFNNRLGLKNRILIIFTNLLQHKNIDLDKLENPIEIGFSKAILIETENRELTKIVPVSNKVNELKNLDLKDIRRKLIENYDYIDLALSIDISLISKLFHNFIMSFNNFNIISKVKTLKKLKKHHYFDVYPKKPEFLYLKKTGTISLIKKILPIFIDKHIF